MKMIKIGLLALSILTILTASLFNVEKYQKKNPEFSVEDASTVGNPNEGFILFSLRK